MHVPENPNNPGEWFDLAEAFVADEGVFSQDQILTLQIAIGMIAQGVYAATKNKVESTP